MNVLYISHETGLGGASLALLEVIDEMSKKNVEIYVSIADNKGSLYEELIKRNVNIIHLKYFTSMSYGKKSILSKLKNCIKSIINIFSIIRLSQIVKHNKIEIIHTNSSVIIIGAFISRLTGSKHIFHIREFSENINRKYRLPTKYVYKFINKNSKKIIVISKALYKHNLEKFSTEKMSLIYDGININKSNFHNKVNKKNKIIKVLITGNISEDKGQEDAIKALDVLVKKGYDNVKFLFAGNKDLSYYKYLIEIINKNNLNDYVEFLGYVEEIERIRCDIDIELNCSRSEGFGRVTIEAMLHGIPIIGANNTATCELIQNEVNGLLYEDGDINQLAQKIIWLIENDNERYRISKSAIEYVLEKFSAQKNGDDIYRMYIDILRGI